MHWSPRLFYALALLLAATPPLLSSQLARPLLTHEVTTERAGLTLGSEHGRRVIVTSLRSGGTADRSGIAVGDELRDVGGQRVTGVAMARRLINDPHHCNVVVDLHRDGVSHVARIQQCRRTAGR